MSKDRFADCVHVFNAQPLFLHLTSIWTEQKRKIIASRVMCWKSALEFENRTKITYISWFPQVSFYSLSSKCSFVLLDSSQLNHFQAFTCENRQITIMNKNIFITFVTEPSTIISIHGGKNSGIYMTNAKCIQTLCSQFIFEFKILFRFFLFKWRQTFMIQTMVQRHTKLCHVPIIYELNVTNVIELFIIEV